MTLYRAVENRCAVHFPSLNLPISHDKALEILARKGFERLDIDFADIAQGLVGKSTYKRGARMYEAPKILDCSSLTKYLYAERGIWIPRRSIQQREYGTRVALKEVVTGDLVFTSGHIDYFLDNPNDGVGHVGFATGEGTIIHAANKRRGIVETSVHDFVGDSLRGTVRLIPKEHEIVTLKTPSNREVETSDDIRWILIQSL